MVSFRPFLEPLLHVVHANGLKKRRALSAAIIRATDAMIGAFGGS
jgi:hypothetical protein